MSTISNSSGAAYSPPANIYAQKANCERQLSDWEHCVSASTPRGKEKIDELQAKLKEINADLRTTSAPDPTQTIGSMIDVHA
jgi:hypothetical protein